MFLCITDFWKLERSVAECVLVFTIASGVGHGTAHAVFFGLSVIVPAFGPATYYTESCKQMPFFLVTGSPPSFSYLQFSLQHQLVICSILYMLKMLLIMH